MSSYQAKRILIRSDLAYEGTLKGWVRACDQILQMDVETIFPGHSCVGNKEDLKLALEYLLGIQEQGGGSLDSAYDPLEAGKGVDLGPFNE